MNTRSTEDRYGAVAVGLHWASAILVIMLVPLGLSMTRLNAGDNDVMYRIHVGVGMSVAILTIVRAIWRFVEPSPETPPMPEWRRTVYIANHAVFYVVLFALATTGVATLVASGIAPIPTNVNASAVEDGRARDAHFILGLVFSALFFMHVIGVMTYQRTKGDVLKRMGVNEITSRQTSAAQPDAKRRSS